MGQMLLDRNENQYGPAPTCYEVLQKANLEQLSLYSRWYTAGKKSELSEWLSRKIGIPEHRVLLSYGSEDMLKQVVHCYLHAGETMLLPQQSWWYYKSVAAEVLANHIAYPLHARNGQFEYDLDEIIRLYEVHRPQIILIASPNNPTGNSIHPDTLNAFVDHCTSAVIVLDEAYYGFSGEHNDHLKGLLASHKKIVVLRTFSKYYALAGLRIGYACAGEDLHQIITYSARYLGYNQLSEKIALAALEEGTYYQRISSQIQKDKQMYYRELGAFEGFTAFLSDANFILVRYPLQQKKNLQEALLQRKIVLKFLDDPGLSDCMRITIGTSEQNAYVIASLQDIVDQSSTPSPRIPLAHL